MTPDKDEVYSAEEREVILADMRRTSDAFYGMAVRTRCHPFIEFCGLINKYIDLCQAAHEAGIDFTNANTHSGTALPVAHHDMRYLAEKLDCIFGPTLRGSPEAREALRSGLGLA